MFGRYNKSIFIGSFDKLRKNFGREIFFTIRERENIVWQLLIKIIKI
jgi:hypothetical protein